MAKTLTARARDYVLRATERVNTTPIDISTTQFFLLIDATHYLLIDTTHKLLLSDATIGVQSPLLSAQYRDYLLTAQRMDGD